MKLYMMKSLDNRFKSIKSLKRIDLQRNNNYYYIEKQTILVFSRLILKSSEELILIL